MIEGIDAYSMDNRNMKLKSSKKRVWIVFVGLCTYYFVAFGLIYNGLGMFLTPISEDLNIPFVQVSFTSTVRILVGMVATAMAGRIIPKINLKWFLSLNVILLIIASFIMSTSQSLWHLLAGSALIGFAAGFGLYAIVPIILNQWFSNPTKYVSIATAAGGAGGIVFCPLVTAAISAFGWRHAYQMVGIIVFFSMLPLAFFVIRYSPEEYGLKPYGKVKSEGIKDLGNEELNKYSNSVSKNINYTSNSTNMAGKSFYRKMYAYLFFFFLIASVLSGMYGHVASAFWSKGFSDYQVGLLTSAYQLGTTVVQFLFGIISLKTGLRKTLNIMLPFIILSSAGLIITDNSMFLLTMIFAVLLGFGRTFGVINPLITRYVFGNQNFTVIYSDLYSVFLIGTAVTATLFGALYNIAGNYNYVYLLVIVCTLAEIVLTHMIFSSIKKGDVIESV